MHKPRRWHTGELAECHCSPSPLGSGPAEVVRGARAGGGHPTLRRGDVEHTCPSATHIRRPGGRPPTGAPSGAVIAVVMTPAHKHHLTKIAGGAGRVSSWALATLLAAAPMPAAPDVPPDAGRRAGRPPRRKR